jgi:hypothetical protein
MKKIVKEFLIFLFSAMPREDPELEAERKARTPYDLIRYRLNKLQENPVSLYAL